MQVYVANLGKYNEGELVGAWFTPPIDFDDLAEKIGLNNEYEEYAIHDYELPFDVDEYTPIAEINRLCEGISELEGTAIYKDDIISYSDCDSMEDVARFLIEESGQLSEVPANLQNYIDYQALGRDMEIEGNFLVTSHGVFEYQS